MTIYLAANQYNFNYTKSKWQRSETRTLPLVILSVYYYFFTFIWTPDVMSTAVMSACVSDPL